MTDPTATPQPPGAGGLHHAVLLYDSDAEFSAVIAGFVQAGLGGGGGGGLRGGRRPVARQVCDLVELRSHRNRTTVRVHLRLDGQPGAAALQEQRPQVAGFPGRFARV